MKNKITIIIAVIALAIVSLTYFSDQGTRYLMLPLMSFFSLFLLAKIIAFIFRGGFVKTLYGSLMWLAAGISVSLLFMNAQGGQNLHSAGVYLLLITIISVSVKVMLYFASGRVYLQAALKSTALL